MKTLKISLLCSGICIFLFLSCGKEDGVKQMDASETKLVSISVASFERDRFYYDEDKLIEMQYDYSTFNETTQEIVTNTVSYSIAYEDDKVSQITSDYREINFDYLGNDLVITTIVNQAVFSELSYKNYKEPLNYSITAINQNDLMANFNLVLDESNNFLHALSDDDVLVEEAYPGYYLVSPFNGVHRYDEKKNPYSNFDPEIQIWLTQKTNINNVVERTFSQLSTRTYEYVYNEEDFPISKATTVLDETTNETYPLNLIEYFYE